VISHVLAYAGRGLGTEKERMGTCRKNHHEKVALDERNDMKGLEKELEHPMRNRS
jgi:hypothetical protein